MKRLAVAAAALLCLIAASAWAETITGVVVEDGHASIRVRADDGKELRLFMDRGMKYVPGDYRAQEGDRVTVVYERETRRNKEDVEAIREIRMESVAPENALVASPQEGFVREVGRKMIKVEFPALGRTLTFDLTRELGKPPVAGQAGTATFTRVPSRFGNGYVYLLNGFTPLNGLPGK